MNKQNESCINRDLITELIQERGLHRTTEILQYKHYLADCYVNCGDIQKDCKMIICAILDKAGSNIQIKP